MPIWLALIIALAILAGVAFPAFVLWLKFKEKQLESDVSAGDLGQAVAAQQKALEAAEGRIRNLEAIVASRDWDLPEAEALPGADGQRVLTAGPGPSDASQDMPEDAVEIARIARRLGT